MPVGVVMVVIDMLEARSLFLLDVSIERAAAHHVEELRSPADCQDRKIAAEGVAQEPNLNLIFERVGLLEVLKIRFHSRVAPRFYVFPLHQQTTPHVSYI